MERVARGGSYVATSEQLALAVFTGQAGGAAARAAPAAAPAPAPAPAKEGAPLLDWKALLAIGLGGLGLWWFFGRRPPVPEIGGTTADARELDRLSHELQARGEAGGTWDADRVRIYRFSAQSSEVEPLDRERMAGWGTGYPHAGNPPSWVADEATWERAKAAVRPSWDTYGEPWAVVAHVYRQMGGREA